LESAYWHILECFDAAIDMPYAGKEVKLKAERRDF